MMRFNSNEHPAKSRKKVSAEENPPYYPAGMLFAQAAMTCKQLGTVKRGHVSTDGTGIKAGASDAKTGDETESADQQEDLMYGTDKTGSEISEGIRNQGKRIAGISAVVPAIKTAGQFPGIFMKKSCGKCAESLIQTPAGRLSAKVLNPNARFGNTPAFFHTF